VSKTPPHPAASHHGAANHSAATPAIAALVRANVAHTLHPYEHDPGSDLGYGLEAAAAIGVDPSRVFKTLCVEADGALAVAIVPVDAMLDLKSLASALGAKKAAMAEATAAERATGYVVGGISPIGQRRRLRTVLDSSALGFDAVYVSGGRRGLDVGLAPGDLVAVTGATTAPIARTA
jgi:Cys-tRNA(Pro)/Cys-tRNA(Cys) deacylase